MKDISVGRLAGLGLLCAALFGVFVWLYTGSALWGLAIGLAFGACMAVALRNVWGSPAFKGLNFQQRRQVMKALRRGEPMRDPKLAPAVVKQGRTILARGLSPKAARIGFAAMFLFGAVAAGFSFAEDGWRGWPNGVLLMALSLVMFFLVPREYQRAARCVEETEKLHPVQVARQD